MKAAGWFSLKLKLHLLVVADGKSVTFDTAIVGFWVVRGKALETNMLLVDKSGFDSSRTLKGVAKAPKVVFRLQIFTEAVDAV